MLRNILAVLAGYLVMAVCVMVVIFVLAAIFPDYRESAENNTAPPTLPVALNLIAGVVCAAFGGLVCYLVAKRNRTPVLVLAGLVFILGIAYAVYYYNSGPQPLWYLVSLPIVSAIGIAAGPAIASIGKR